MGRTGRRGESLGGGLWLRAHRQRMASDPSSFHGNDHVGSRRWWCVEAATEKDSRSEAGRRSKYIGGGSGTDLVVVAGARGVAQAVWIACSGGSRRRATSGKA